MKLTDDHLELLTSLANGSTLKSHRDIDGTKIYRLRHLDGLIEMPRPQVVDQVKKGSYIDSNKKFPAATYLLTDRGRQAVSAVTQEDVSALSTRNYKP